MVVLRLAIGVSHMSASTVSGLALEIQGMLRWKSSERGRGEVDRNRRKDGLKGERDMQYRWRERERDMQERWRERERDMQ